MFTQERDLSERLLLRMGRAVGTRRCCFACFGRQSRVQEMSSSVPKVHRFRVPRSGVSTVRGLQTRRSVCRRLSHRVLRHDQHVIDGWNGTGMYALRHSVQGMLRSARVALPSLSAFQNIQGRYLWNCCFTCVHLITAKSWHVAKNSIINNRIFTFLVKRQSSG